MNKSEQARRVALITGGAGGIGAATAKKIAASGVQVVVVDVRGPAAASIASSLPNEAFALEADLAEISECKRVIDEVLRLVGNLHILVNCAGIAPMVPIPDVTVDLWDKVVAVNLRAIFFLCQLAAEPMAANGWGRIVNVSSVGARTGGMGPLAPYCATKAGVLALTKSFASYLSRRGVTVNAVAPGPTRSGMTAEWDPNYVAQVESAILAGRFAYPEEIANAIAFLASDEASYITGSTVDVNGGLRMD
jgi:3-oxoacyl-[acyl-carrier protein] reductase